MAKRKNNFKNFWKRIPKVGESVCDRGLHYAPITSMGVIVAVNGSFIDIEWDQRDDIALEKNWHLSVFEEPNPRMIYLDEK